MTAPSEHDIARSVLGDDLLALARTLEPLVDRHGERAVVAAVRLAAEYRKAKKAVPDLKAKTGPKPAVAAPFYAWLFLEARVRGGRGHRTASGVADGLFADRRRRVVIRAGANPLSVTSAGRLKNLHSEFECALARMTPAQQQHYQRLAERVADIHRVSRR